MHDRYSVSLITQYGEEKTKEHKGNPKAKKRKDQTGLLHTQKPKQI